MGRLKASEIISIEFAKRGIIGTAVDDTVDKVVASIPEAIRGIYPDNKFEAALAFLPTYWKEAQHN